MNRPREVFGQLVWAPDPKDGFRLCKICDIGSETMSVELIDGGLTVNFPSIRRDDHKYSNF